MSVHKRLAPGTGGAEAAADGPLDVCTGGGGGAGWTTTVVWERERSVRHDIAGVFHEGMSHKKWRRQPAVPSLSLAFVSIPWPWNDTQFEKTSAMITIMPR